MDNFNEAATVIAESQQLQVDECELVIPSIAAVGAYDGEIARPLVAGDIIPNDGKIAITPKSQFKFVVPASGYDDGYIPVEGAADSIFERSFTTVKPSGKVKENTNYNSCRNSDDTEARGGLEPSADNVSGRLHGDRNNDQETTHQQTSDGPPSGSQTTPALPADDQDGDGPDTVDAAAGGGNPRGRDGGGAMSALAVVPAVRPADVPALAAAFGVRQLPPALDALARPTIDGTIDVREAEREAAAFLHPGTDPELLARILGTRAPGTYRVYGMETTQLARHCAKTGETAMPASAATLARWAFALADDGKTFRRIKRMIDAVAAVHTMLGCKAPTQDPLVRGALASIARQFGRAPDHKEAAFRPAELRAALTYLEQLEKTAPERAALIRSVLSLGVGTALRRESLVALDTDDIELLKRGMRVRVNKTKTTSESDPPIYLDVARVADVRICPVASLERYAKVCRLTPGPLFRGTLPDGSLRRSRLAPSSVLNFVREVVEKAGIGDPKAYGAHSLRAGFITAAYEAGLPMTEIKRTSLHLDDDQAYDYVRPTEFSRTSTRAVFE